MSMRKLSAGDNIEARCTRCRALLNHTIVAMVGERVVRVECNTCRGMHNYIPEKTAAGTAAPRAAVRKSGPASPKSKREPGAAERQEWETLLATAGGKQAIPYDMSARFRVNDLVDHATFGLGIVRLLVAPGKVQILFNCGVKLLRCQ